MRFTGELEVDKCVHKSRLLKWVKWYKNYLGKFILKTGKGTIIY